MIEKGSFGKVIPQKDDVNDVDACQKMIYYQRLMDMSHEIQEKSHDQMVMELDFNQLVHKATSKTYSENNSKIEGTSQGRLEDFMNDDQKDITGTFRSRYAGAKKATRYNKKKGLKNLVRNLKVKNLVSNFAEKVKINSLKKDPVEFNPFKQKTQDNNQLTGLQFNGFLLSIFYLISILYIVILCYFSSLSMVFTELINSTEIFDIEIFGVVWILIEIFVNFVRVKNETSERIEKLNNIAKKYAKNIFWMDLLCQGALILDIIFGGKWTMYLRLVFLLRIYQIPEKVRYLETKLLNTSYKEHYWGLGKIFLTNFIFAHFLSILLILMTFLDMKNNWLSSVNAIGAPWYEQYSWAYYWGTTIMLTVGFGDISAANYKEAICLTFIETLGCITLAYNINCVGTLIANIRAEQLQKEKKQKILKHLSEKNEITYELTSKISNYIEQSSNIRKKFNLQEQNYFFSTLPDSLKKDFLRESNTKIFNGIMFFKSLSEQSLVKLAESIETAITHPEQIIQKMDDHPQVLILKQGKVSYTSKINDCDFNGSVVDCISVKEGQIPVLLSNQFLVPTLVKNYELKSQSYSILYKMTVQQLKQILKQKEKDLQYYFFLKDKSKHLVNEFETIVCEFCKTRHSKFRCPKLHFIPIKQLVIFKEIHQQNKMKSQRRFVIRRKKKGNTFQEMQPKREKRQSVTFSPLILASSLIKTETIDNDSSRSKSKSLKNDEILKKSMIQQIVDNMKDQVFGCLNQGTQDLWLIETDTMKDYQFYFPESNTKNLSEKYPGKTKKKKKNSSNNTVC